ncbi:hypothetical protein FJQ54_15120 [Sandaracinobacter neustonicus]|uniref:Uncharacterized protein n=1 Tax=Sandaracinobacter neustonicus TaxID=1715348 RepID=A0A501XFD3_9SPHN|nr:hypothetical protein [Sandaracinobacter neustonicus]TPE59119.1 hypothetical protein FJQ54_15120 [Sandaracinobacter neustonicus]
MPSSISFSDFLLVVGVVGGLMLIAGATLRPWLEDVMDRAGRRLRVEVHDDRKITIYVPEGVELSWQGRQYPRVVQQEVVLENNTRSVFHEVELRLRYRPFNNIPTDEPLLLGMVVPPTPNAVAVARPPAVRGERVIEFEYISPQSQVTMLVFSNHDGEISFETLCDREIVLRHVGVLFSENVQKVMPAWMEVLKPIVLPFTIVTVVRERLRRRKRQ